MNQKYSIFVDVSGSTGGSLNYWTTVQHIVDKYAPQIDNYYQWDTSINMVTKQEMYAQINSKTGKGGTSPQVVAQQIKQNNYKRVILITDGQVSDHNVRECDKLLEGYQFGKTVCFIIASSNYGGLNMSVTCPFTRKCENQVYEKHEGKQIKQLAQFKPEDYKILDTLDEITLENFEANYEKIEGLIIAINMGRQGNIPLKNQLVVMKKRLVKELSKRKGEKDINQILRGHLQKGDIELPLGIIGKITKDYFSESITQDLEKKINHLISLCGDLRGKYDLGQIKSNKMAHAEDAKEGQLDQNADIHDLTKNLIECPIIMDEDVPQILVDQCEPIFVGIQKAIIDDISACPIRLLNYPEVKAKLKSRLSNYMGVKFSDKFMKNPFTQGKLLGAIPLGSHQSHVKVGNYTISRMFSDGKILGNLNMFFAAIWHIIKEKQIEYLKDVEKNVSQHLIYRLKNSQTMASLCGLSQFVTTQMNSDLAVWFCVHSGYLNMPTNKDTFRFHLFNMQYLIEIVKLLGYPIDKGVSGHLARTKSYMKMLAAYKKLKPSLRKNFKQAIRSLSQNSIQINPKNLSKQFRETQTIVRFVPIDGKANPQRIKQILNLLPKDIQQLEIQQIIHISNMINEQDSASNIVIDYNFKANAVPEAVVSWDYGLKEQKQFNAEEFKICPKTLRLCSTYDKKQWQTYLQQKTKIPTKNLFKARKYFQSFLRKYNQMPTKDELILYYYNKYIISNKKQTLPYLTQQWAQKLITQYSKVFEENKITIENAVKILQESMPRKNREKMEGK